MTSTLAAVEVWPAALYAVLVLVVAALILTLSWLLGERQSHGSEAEQYESGIKPAGPLPRRLSLEFYQIALFFVVFDLEAAFIFAWAVNARALGWLGYLELLVFVVLLLAALVYLWRVGALDWGPGGGRRAAGGRLPASAAPDPAGGHGTSAGTAAADAGGDPAGGAA